MFLPALPRLYVTLSAGPWKNDYAFFCQIGGICEISIEVVNARATDKVLMASSCGGSADLMGFSQPLQVATGASSSAVFRWEKRLSLSENDMKAGLEVCWKAIEDEASPSDLSADYSAKFGTVSIRGKSSSSAARVFSRQ